MSSTQAGGVASEGPAGRRAAEGAWPRPRPTAEVPGSGPGVWGDLGGRWAALTGRRFRNTHGFERIGLKLRR